MRKKRFSKKAMAVGCASVSLRNEHRSEPGEVKNLAMPAGVGASFVEYECGPGYFSWRPMERL